MLTQSEPHIQAIPDSKGTSVSEVDEYPDSKGFQNTYKLNKSLYEINQASVNWFDFLKTGLKMRGHHQYQLDPCVFYRKETVILSYFDNCVILSLKQETIT